MKMSYGDLIIGDSEMINDNDLSITKPYTIIDIGKGPQLIPYELHLLMEPMEQITLRLFDVVWSKSLDEFPLVEKQYFAASTGLETSSNEQIILD